MEDKNLEQQVLEELNNEEELAPQVTKEVKVLLNVDYKTLTYYNVYYMKNIKHFNIVYLIMIIVAIGFGVYNYIATKSIPLSVIMLIFAGYMLYSMLSFEKTIDKQLSQHFRVSRPVKQVYTINNLGFSVHTEGKEDISYEWTYVSNVHITNNYYYLFLGKTPLIIDRNPENLIEGTSEDLDAIIEEVALAKPVKRCTKEIVKNFKDFDYPDYDEMERARAEALAEIEAEEQARLQEEQQNQESENDDTQGDGE